MDTPPQANLLVIRSFDMHQAVAFYRHLGLMFQLHSHGGPEHYSAEADGFVFEIYPQRTRSDQTASVRFGFAVKDVDRLVASLTEDLKTPILSPPANTPWGRRAVVQDLDGHAVELLEKNVSESGQ